MIHLQTKRMIIRDHYYDDLPTQHALFSNQKTMYYLQDISTNTLEQSEDNLKAAIDDITNPNRKFYFLRMECKDTKEHIGEVGYTVNEVTPVGKLVRVGYFTHKQFWGRGYTTEALLEIIRFAFEENGVYRISCGCIKDNIGSEKVMIHCGMIKEAEYKDFVWHDGRLKDRVEYRMLRSEWK